MDDARIDRVTFILWCRMSAEGPVSVSELSADERFVARLLIRHGLAHVYLGHLRQATGAEQIDRWERMHRSRGKGETSG